MSEEERGEQQKIYKLEWLVPDSVFVLQSSEKPWSLFRTPKHSMIEVLRVGINDLVKGGYRIRSLASMASENSSAATSGVTDRFVGVVERDLEA